jgi:uncharacterized protein YdhG (YjbR/CyaY superfamily)
LTENRIAATKTKTTVAKDIEAYLAAVPKESRAALENLRQTIKSVVPEADEVISYQIPTFKLDGRMLVSYAAFSEHCSFFPGSGPIEAHECELRTYQTSKGTVRFTVERPLSASLIKKLVKTRVSLNDAALKKRASGNRTKKVK